MRIKVSIDGDKEFRKTMEKYAKTSKRGMDKTLAHVAGKAGESLAFQTSMFGLKKATQKALDKGVIADARAAYPKRSVVYKMLKEQDPRKAAGFNKAMRKQDIKAAEKIAASVINVKLGKDSGSFLPKLRKERGRILDPKRVMIGNTAPEVYAIIKTNKQTVARG